MSDLLDKFGAGFAPTDGGTVGAGPAPGSPGLAVPGIPMPPDLGTLVTSAGTPDLPSPMSGFPTQDTSPVWGERLLWSDDLADGQMSGARQWHGTRQAERVFQLASHQPVSTVTGPPVGLEVGMVARQHPGLKARTASLLSAQDFDQLARKLTGLSDGIQLGHVAGTIETYADRLTDVDPTARLGAAQLDWAKMQHAVESGVLKRSTNRPAHDLWDRFVSNPEAMGEPDKERLLGMVQRLGDATRGNIEPDLSLDMVSKVSRVDLTDTGAVIFVSAPTGWDVDGALDPNVRTARLAQLNLRPLAVRAKGTLSRLYARSGPSGTVPSDGTVQVDRHLADIFFGVATHTDAGLAAKLGSDFHSTVTEVVDQTAEELGVTPGELVSKVRASWKELKAEWNHHSNSWVRGRGPFRLPEVDGSENSVYQALQGRATSGVKDVYAGIPETVMYVTGQVDGSGMSISPTGKGSIVGPVTDVIASTVRHLYPAVVRPDGVAVWGRGYPVPVRDLDRLQADLGRDLSGHEVERWTSAAFGGQHPATMPGSTAMVDVVEGTKLGAGFKPVDPGEPALWENPTPPPAGLRPVGLDEFVRSRRTAEGPEMPPNPSTVWQGHKFWLNADGTAGMAISSKGELTQLFNGSLSRGYGGELVEYAKIQGATSLAVPGVDGETLKEFFAKHEFVDAGDGRMVLADDAEVRPARVRARTRRVAVKLSAKDLADLESTVARIEGSGSKVRTVYSPGRPPQGWTTVRDHVFTDGAGMMVLRSATSEQVSPNGYTAWVRDADAASLPKQNPTGDRTRQTPVQSTVDDMGRVNYGNLAVADSDVLTTGVGFRVLFRDGSVPLMSAAQPTADDPTYVQRLSGKFVVTANDPDDITDQTRIVDLLGRIGVDPSKIRLNVAGEVIQMDHLKPTPSKGRVPTSWNFQVSPPKRTGKPLPELLDRYGIAFDPHFRDPVSKVMARIDPTFDAEIGDVVGRVMESLPEMAKMAEFGRITVGDWDSPSASSSAVAPFAWYVLDRGGPIVLSRDYWSDPGRLVTELEAEHAAGFFNKNLPATPGSLIAHETGHMLHQALRSSFSTAASAGLFDQELSKLSRNLGVEGVASGLSRYAAANVEEFVAEAMAEALHAAKPRPLALQVYNLVVDRFSENTAKVETLRWGSRPA